MIHSGIAAWLFGWRENNHSCVQVLLKPLAANRQTSCEFHNGKLALLSELALWHLSQKWNDSIISSTQSKRDDLGDMNRIKFASSSVFDCILKKWKANWQWKQSRTWSFSMLSHGRNLLRWLETGFVKPTMGGRDAWFHPRWNQLEKSQRESFSSFIPLDMFSHVFPWFGFRYDFTLPLRLGWCFLLDPRDGVCSQFEGTHWWSGANCPLLAKSSTSINKHPPATVDPIFPFAHLRKGFWWILIWNQLFMIFLASRGGKQSKQLIRFARRMIQGVPKMQTANVMCFWVICQILIEVNQLGTNRKSLDHSSALHGFTFAWASSYQSHVDGSPSHRLELPEQGQYMANISKMLRRLHWKFHNVSRFLLTKYFLEASWFWDLPTYPNARN